MNKTMTNEQYLALINQEPTEVEDGDGYQYIKKSVLQQQLIEDFNGTDSWEMIRETVTKTGMYGVGRLSYIHPATGVVVIKTGTAAISHSDSKMPMDFPALEAACIKNSAKKIGRRYGMYLNVDKEDEEPASEVPVINVANEDIISRIHSCETTEQLGKLKPEVGPGVMHVYLRQMGVLAKTKTIEDASV